MYCRAHLVSASIWPDNKITPCCLWLGDTYETYTDMKHKVGAMFESGNVPSWCQTCSYKNAFNDYSLEDGIQYLDIRNDNICNLKCRSCGPGWSSRWASELSITPSRNFKPFSLETINLQNLKKLYYCGGEPFLAEQHAEFLNSITNPANVQLVYNTNCTTLHYKSQYIPDLWKPFKGVVLNLSLDAVESAAEVVRSGTNWQKTEKVLNELLNLSESMPVQLNLTPVLSALNIWWFDQYLKYFDDWEVNAFHPITATDEYIGLGIIPHQYRSELIQMLSESKFTSHFAHAIDILKNQDNTSTWASFVTQQAELDKLRNETWISQLKSSYFWY